MSTTARIVGNIESWGDGLRAARHPQGALAADGATDDSGALAALDSSYGYSMPVGTVLVSASVTVTVEELAFPPGAKVRVATGATLTLNLDRIDAGPWEIFELQGTGQVVISDEVTVSPRWFGAVGDGATNDQPAWKAALAAAKRIRGVPGDTYLIQKDPSDTTTDSKPLCLIVDTDHDIDLNGSTLKLADSQDAALIVGKSGHVAASTPEDIAIHGGTIDGNEANQDQTAGKTFVPTLYFSYGTSWADYSVKGLKLYDLKILNANLFGIYTTYSVEGYYNNVKVIGGLGGAFSFHDKRSKGDDLFVDDVVTVGDSNAPGNGFLFSVFECQFGKIHQRNCAWAVKIQDASEDSQFDEILVEGGANSEERGVKLQGTSSAARNKNIQVGRVIVKDCPQGLYLTNNEGVQIGEYIGEGNGQVVGDAKEGSDVLIFENNTDVYIGECRSNDCVGPSLWVQGASAADNYNVRIGKYTARGFPGRLAYLILSDSVEIGELRGYMEGGTPSATDLVFVDVVTSLRIGYLFYDAAVATGKLPIRVNDNATTELRMGPLQMGAALETWGVQTLANASSTTVSNKNVALFSSGGKVQPVVSVHPIDSASMALAPMRVVPTSHGSGGGFTLHHGAAAGTEKVLWRLEGYVSFSDTVS